jgi:TRAP-type C4-dicarboxylate transport system permease small subunit
MGAGFCRRPCFLIKLFGAPMKKTLLFLREIMEFYVPAVSFIVMFITFVLQVFFRYVVHHALTWTMDIIVLGFIFTVLFGACYTMRLRYHVKFTMFYDRLAPKPAAVLRLAGNVLILIAFIIIIPSSWAYSLFMSFQKIAVTRLPLTVIYIPFVYFLLSIIGYTLMETGDDIRVIRGVLEDTNEHASAYVKKETVK